MRRQSTAGSVHTAPSIIVSALRRKVSFSFA